MNWLKRLICCILEWLSRLFGCTPGSQSPAVPLPADPRVPRSTKPPGPQIMLRLRDGLGPFDSDRAAQEALSREPEWQRLLAALGVPELKVRRAVGVDRNVLIDLRRRAEQNAKRFDFNSPDPKLGSYVHVTLPPNASTDKELVDVYCAIRSQNLSFATKVQFGQPPRNAQVSHEHLDRTGAPIVVTSVLNAQMGPLSGMCAIVDIEEAWPFPEPGSVESAGAALVLARVPIQDSSGSRSFVEFGDTDALKHGAKTICTLTSSGLHGVTGVVPGAQIYACPSYTNLQADELPSDMATAVASAAHFLFNDQRTQSAFGKVIVIPMQAWNGAPIETELDSTAATILEVMHAGIPIVTAAGNNSADLSTFTPNMNALVVAAGTSQFNHLQFGALTIGSGFGAGADCFALGDGIASWKLENGIGGWAITGQDEYGDTSGASTIVAGVVALMGALRQTDPNRAGEQAPARTPLHPVQIRALLRNTQGVQTTNVGTGALTGKFMPDVDQLKDAIRAL